MIYINTEYAKIWRFTDGSDEETKKRLQLVFQIVKAGLEDVPYVKDDAKMDGSDQRTKGQLELAFEIVKGGLEDIPIVTNVVKMVAPVVDVILDPNVNKDDLKAVQSDLRTVSFRMRNTIIWI